MRVIASLLSAAMIPLLVAPAMAAPRPSSIPLPDDFQPEGIAVGEDSTFYVGSLRDGDIYRGDLRSGKGKRFVDVDNRVAVGMRVDDARDWLVVAGGATGRAWVYDTEDGTTAARLRLGPRDATFSNDVAITQDALYFTDTFAARIYKVPIRADGTFGATKAITVTGPAAATGGFGLNGIDSTHRPRLLVAHTTSASSRSSTRPPGSASACGCPVRHWSRERSTACSSRAAPHGWSRTSTTPWLASGSHRTWSADASSR